MKTISPIQVSFLGGEISPEIYGRIDVENYRQGLEVCENFIIDSFGSLHARTGFRFRQSLIGDKFKLKCIHAEEDNFLAVLSQKLGAINCTTYKIAYQYETRYVSNNNFTGNRSGWSIFITDPATGQQYEYGLREDNVEIDITSGFASIKTDREVELKCMFYNKDTDNLKNFLLRVEGVVLKHPLNIEVGNPSTSVQVNIPIGHPSATVDTTLPVIPDWYEIKIHIPAGAEVVLDQVEVFKTEPSFTQVDTQDLPAYDNIDLDDISLVPLQYLGNLLTKYAILILNKDIKPHLIHTTGLVQEMNTNYQTGDTNAQPQDPWSPGNYPTSGEMYQNRLWLVGFADKSSTIMASEAGDIFTYGDGVSAKSKTPINKTLAGVGKIKWIKESRELLIGTDRAEYTIVPGDPTENELHSNNFGRIEQSRYTTSFTKPESIGNILIFTTADREVIRSMYYKWLEQGWVSDNLSDESAHILAGKVKDLTIIRSPSKAICALLEDGSIAICFYKFDSTQKTPTLSWGRFTTRGIIHEFTNVETRNGTELWMVVCRDGDMMLESYKMIYPHSNIRVSSEPHEEVFLDSVELIEDINTTDTLGITRADLQGKELPLALDRSKAGTAIIDTDVKFHMKGFQLYAGYPIIYRVRTLPLIIMDGSESNILDKKRIVEVGITAYNSVAPTINGSRSRVLSTFDDVRVLFNKGVQQYVVEQIGFHDYPQLEIVHDIPAPLHILSIGVVTESS
jgi:hypothetical protein